MKKNRNVTPILTMLLQFTGFNIADRIGTYRLLPYTPHGIKNGNYFMFKSNSFLLFLLSTGLKN